MEHEGIGIKVKQAPLKKRCIRSLIGHYPPLLDKHKKAPKQVIKTS